MIFILISKFHSLGTYTGNLGLLQRKEALIYIKHEPLIANEEWLKLSNPVLTEK